MRQRKNRVFRKLSWFWGFQSHRLRKSNKFQKRVVWCFCITFAVSYVGDEDIPVEKKKYVNDLIKKKFHQTDQYHVGKTKKRKRKKEEEY